MWPPGNGISTIAVSRVVAHRSLKTVIFGEACNRPAMDYRVLSRPIFELHARNSCSAASSTNMGRTMKESFIPSSLRGLLLFVSAGGFR